MTNLTMPWLDSLLTKQQGHGYLCFNNHYCCIGVGAELLQLEIEVDATMKYTRYITHDTPLTRSAYPAPYILARWDIALLGLTHEEQIGLTHLNDGYDEDGANPIYPRHTFQEIREIALAWLDPTILPPEHYFTCRAVVTPIENR